MSDLRCQCGMELSHIDEPCPRCLPDIAWRPEHGGETKDDAIECLTAERDRLDEEIKNLKAMLEADCEHMVDLETIKKVLNEYLSITEDCCKGEKACLRCQHRDWFRTFIEGG